MSALAALAAVLASVEAALRLPVLSTAASLPAVAARAAATLKRAGASDRSKERALVCYARSMASRSILLAAWLVLSAMPLLGLTVLADWAGLATLEWLASAQGLLLSSVAAAAYAWVRLR